MRTYDFTLPCIVSSFMLSLGWGEVHNDPLFYQLPLGLRQKVMTAHTNGDDLVITKGDLDSVPDSIWERVAEKFNLGSP